MGFKPKKTQPRSKAASRVGPYQGPYRVDRKFYTSGQAARLLNIPDRTLRRYLSTGKIDGIQHPITGTWQIEKEALAAFIEQCGCSVITQVTPTQVLVVHDDPERRASIETAVEHALPEATVQTADNPLNALIRIGEDCPDVVILKADIPGLSCRDFLTAIKNNVTTGEIKTIVLREGPEDPQETAQLGADATIQTPYSVEDIEQIFKSLFDPQAN